MNPDGLRIVLRPRNALESLDLAVIVLRENFAAFSRLAAALLVLPALVLPFLSPGWEWDWALFLLVALAAPVLQLPFTVLAGQRMFDPQAGVVSSLRQARQAWVAVPLVWFATVVAAFTGLFSLGVVGLVVHLALLWVAEVAALERLGGWASVKRSVVLSMHSPGRAIMGSFVGFALLAWVVLATELVGQSLVGFVLQLGTPFGSLQAGDLTPFLWIGLLLAQPVVAVFRVVLYVDLRTAVDAWDIQVAMRAAAEAA